MSRTVSASVDVPGGVDAAWAVLTGPGWAPALDAALRDGSALLSSEPSPDGGLVQVIARNLPEGGPSFVRALVPAGARVVQTDRWAPHGDGVRQAAWSAQLTGTPTELGGRMLLEPVLLDGTATGCRWTVTGTLSVRVPLVGGRVEAFLAPLLEQLIAKQGEVLRTLL